MEGRTNLARVEGRTEGLAQTVESVLVGTLAAAGQAVLAGAYHMEVKIKARLADGTRTGREYYVNPPRRRADGTRAKSRNSRRARYTASAPGEPPAVKRGKLRQAVTHTKPKQNGGEIVSFVGVDKKVIPYARRLEFGGASQTKQGGTVMIEPRPYMRPTFFEQEAEVVRIMQREMETER
jgi:hypothetical protein